MNRASAAAPGWAPAGEPHTSPAAAAIFGRRLPRSDPPGAGSASSSSSSFIFFFSPPPLFFFSSSFFLLLTALTPLSPLAEGRGPAAILALPSPRHHPGPLQKTPKNTSKNPPNGASTVSRQRDWLSAINYCFILTTLTGRDSPCQARRRCAPHGVRRRVPLPSKPAQPSAKINTKFTRVNMRPRFPQLGCLQTPKINENREFSCI